MTSSTSIHLKNSASIAALGADSLLLGGGHSVDDGRTAGDAGGAVLRLQSRAARPGQSLVAQDRPFVDFYEVRAHLGGTCSSDVGRALIDPELMIRMLIVGYSLGIRSERRLCDEVHLNLAYRWFCRLGLDSDVPDHSTFSKNRHGRFRESDLLRKLFGPL